MVPFFCALLQVPINMLHLYRTNIRSVMFDLTIKRDKILFKMLELVVKQGIQGTPMSQLVKESGVAAGTIYHHFSSKEEILNELYLHLKVDFGKALTKNLNPEVYYQPTFEQIWANLYHYYCDNELAFQFSEQIIHSPIITEETRLKGEIYYLPILEFFQAGIDDKILREMDLRLMTNLIYGNVVTAVHLTISGDLIMTDERLSICMASSWDSIKLNTQTN